MNCRGEGTSPSLGDASGSTNALEMHLELASPGFKGGEGTGPWSWWPPSYNPRIRRGFVGNRHIFWGPWRVDIRGGPHKEIPSSFCKLELNFQEDSWPTRQLGTGAIQDVIVLDLRECFKSPAPQRAIVWYTTIQQNYMKRCVSTSQWHSITWGAMASQLVIGFTTSERIQNPCAEWCGWQGASFTDTYLVLVPKSFVHSKGMVSPQCLVTGCITIYIAAWALEPLLWDVLLDFFYLESTKKTGFSTINLSKRGIPEVIHWSLTILSQLLGELLWNISQVFKWGYWHLLNSTSWLLTINYYPSWVG